jgi:hypothetical protein
MMKLDYEGTEYELDFDEITVAQATYIQAKTKLTLLKLVEGFAEGSMDALRAVWWLMHAQTEGAPAVDITQAGFGKPMKLITAYAEAVMREHPEQEADPKAG